MLLLGITGDCVYKHAFSGFLNIEVYWERLKRGLKGSARVYDSSRFLTFVLGSSRTDFRLTPVASVDRETALFVVKHSMFENSEYSQ